MRIEIDDAGLVDAIVENVIERLKPLLSNKNQDGDFIFGIQELSKYLGVTPKWVYERTHFKEIPYYKLGKKLKFKKRDIDKWMDSKKVPSIDTSDRILNYIKNRKNA